MRGKLLHPHTYRMALLVLMMVTSVLVSDLPAAGASEAMDTVKGTGCYRFGDEETPARARRTAVAMAQEQAIRSHRVFVESSSKVKNYQL